MSRFSRFHFTLMVVALTLALTQNSEAGNAATQSAQANDKGWFEDTLSYARNELDRLQRSLGADDPSTLAALDTLGGLWLERGDYAEAETLYLRILKAKMEKLGLNADAQTAATMNRLAEILRARDERSKADEMYQESLQILEKISPESPEIAISLNGMAEIARLKQDYARAEPLYSRALEIHLKLKQKDPNYAGDGEVLNNMGQLYRDKKDAGKAEQFFQRAITSYEEVNLVLRVWRKIKKTASGGSTQHEFTQIVVAIENLGDLYQAKGNYAAAEPLYRRALAFREEAFGAKHRLVGETLAHLAQLLNAKGDKAGAAELQQRAKATGYVAAAPEPVGRTDRKIAGLIGPVKNVLLEKLLPSGPIREEMITYDDQGRKIELLTYSSTGDLKQKVIYKYEEGRLKEELRYGPTDTLTGKTVYTFDASGRRATSVSLNQTGAVLSSTAYAYDAKGNLTEEKTKSSFTFADRNVVYTYNAEGDLVSETGSGGTGLRKSTRYRYEYGKIVQESRENAPESITIDYDSKGNIEKRTTHFIYTYTVESYKYNYDDQGNWTKQVIVREVTTMPGPDSRALSGKKEQFTEFHQRKITYF